jgi:predicted 2-oxoglutarate/Fe(II)-dependent dioxygenase YbiX
MKVENLNYMMMTEETLMDKTQGTLIIFPSYVLHEVMPVTKGD